jgi:alcohol dehydrogenase (cytochrome c)
MRIGTNSWAVAATVVALTTLHGGSGHAAPVSSDDLLGAQDNAAEWLMYGRDYRNQRFSPLDQITPENVKELRPVWAFSTGGALAGLEATPLFRDGVLYFSTDYSRVFAVDARTGTTLWFFEPEYEEGLEAMLCCGPVNRGVALKDDLVFVNTLDARLYALSRDDGAVVWQQTIDDWKQAVTATGAPLVVKDKVIVGIGGAEYGVRGYLKAYDAATGELAWQTYTIPGPGEPGNETWPGDTWMRGGATTWQTGAYDVETDTLFWGTGNPGPWNSDLRKGDNLWSSSLLALDPETGAIKWGYQYTPNDAWDYDGNNAPILIDVEIDGQPVKAAVQSNRNGFFYVLDRSSGEFIYAVPTIEGINWATGLDPKDGRPQVDEAMRPVSGGETIEPIVPGLEGGTNWFPMAYNPDLGYVFFATNHWAMALTAWPPDEVVYKPGEPYMGVDYQMYRLEDDIGYIKAFDVAEKEFIWERPSPLPLFAGLLATRSGLVFTGDQLGHAMALDARTGEVLWQFQTGSGINASPITYELDGTQYIALLSGLGGDPSFYFKGPKGGMFWVFALESEVAGAEASGGEGMNPVPIEGALPTFSE